MNAYVLLGVVLLCGVLLFIRWLQSADPARMAKSLKITGTAAIGAVALFLALTGRLAGAIAALTAVAPLFMHWRTWLRRLRSAAGPSPGQRSRVATAWLAVTLDHDSGDMDGEVLAGPRRGRKLADMDEAELLDLRRELRVSDPQAVPLIEAYLDRRLGTAWRAGERTAPGEEGKAAQPRGSAMTAEEAYEVLGLGPEASRDDIVAAHRRLMVRLHPDQGGSTYLAAKINQARDVLLGR
jgi:hypothetical protein